MENIQHDARQMGKTMLCMESVWAEARAEALRIIDPKAAERAKRYIWSRIERNDTSRRAGK